VVTVKVHFETDSVDQLLDQAGARELLVELDRGASETLSAQLERRLRDGVRHGRLKPGSALPSTRGLAAQLGVSRGLVVAAYAQLAAEGYLSLRRGAAPRVAAGPAATPPPAQPARRLHAPPRHNLQPNLPDHAAFPRERWLASYRRALKAAPDRELLYGDARGAEAARAALVSYLGRVRGVSAHEEHTLVCNGFAQALGLLCAVLRRAGRETMGVEDPGHAVIRGIVARSGLRPVPLPVDVDGIDVDALEAATPDAVLVSPAHQFPTGVVLSTERRARLLEWAERTDALVAEDDYDAEFRYDRTPVGAVQGLDPDRVVHVGTASKTLAPGVRLGWMSTPAELTEELRLRRVFSDSGSPAVDQLALAHLLSTGEFERHVLRARNEYKRRRDRLVRALSKGLPRLEFRGAAAGMQLLVRLGDDVDDVVLSQAAASRGIGIRALSPLHIGSNRARGLLLGFGRLPETRIDAAVGALASVIREAGADRPR
jgi:GntR family transcriptional regulator / MocR family aminotransferase